METKIKQETKSKVHIPVAVRRDYYFHADEDFREDREWGKINADQISSDSPEILRSIRA
ncbi:MAG: hypothetical protein V4594_04740 [Bacteroidota bacterium]